jgi:hypothetical protein
MLRVALQGNVSGKLLARTWPRINMTQLGVWQLQRPLL